ncbi:phytanoyl-CoA dioxygenase family protein, partial [Alphaproteobacteria bacterium]|nr:phytanoyl-CoA dioxygenase family protein [Alphaproteobacteria bacterium]
KKRHLEVEGYTILPKAVDASRIKQIKKEMKDAPMQTKDYSDCQTFHLEPQWYSPAVASLIANSPVVEFLEELCGPEIIFTRGFFHRTLPGSPPVSMHTDGQPFGSSIFGYEGSSPKLLRVIYYFDDLNKERAPFRILPRSHLSFHAEANPYKRYKSHPEEITICAEAGTAIVFPVNIFHGVHPNLADTRRTMVQFGYRPIWAGPIKPMEEWDPELVEKAPKETKRFLKSVNSSGVEWEQPHKPKGMKSEASAINPSRWDK